MALCVRLAPCPLITYGMITTGPLLWNGHCPSPWPPSSTTRLQDCNGDAEQRGGGLVDQFSERQARWRVLMEGRPIVLLMGMSCRSVSQKKEPRHHLRGSTLDLRRSGAVVSRLRSHAWRSRACARCGYRTCAALYVVGSPKLPLTKHGRKADKRGPSGPKRGPTPGGHEATRCLSS